MKYYAFILGFVIVFFTVFSCGSDSPADEKPAAFDRPEKIECDSIAIGQIRAPLGWTVNGDKVAILSRSTDSICFVYRASDFKYQYSFGREGNGPDDFLYPRFIPDVSGKGQLLIPGAQKISRVDLGDTKAVISGTQKYEGYESPQMLVNDSIVLAMGASSHGGVFNMFCQTVNTKSKQRVDSTQLLIHTKGIRERTGRFNFPHLAVKAGRMAVVYGDVPRIDIFAVSPEGKLTLEQSKGEQLTQDQINALDIASRPNGTDVFGAQGSDKYIYVFAYDYEKAGNRRKLLNSYMEVYDWDGNPVKRFDLGRLFNRFLVDETLGRLFCFNFTQDFEQVYVYPFKI